MMISAGLLGVTCPAKLQKSWAAIRSPRRTDPMGMKADVVERAVSDPGREKGAAMPGRWDLAENAAFHIPGSGVLGTPDPATPPFCTFNRMRHSLNHLLRMKAVSPFQNQQTISDPQC